MKLLHNRLYLHKNLLTMANETQKPTTEEKGKDGNTVAQANVEKNKPLGQDVVLTGPKKTGSKPGTNKIPKGAERVDVQNTKTGFVHTQIPVATFDTWNRSWPGKFQVVDSKEAAVEATAAQPE